MLDFALHALWAVFGTIWIVLICATILQISKNERQG